MPPISKHGWHPVRSGALYDRRERHPVLLDATHEGFFEHPDPGVFR
jgi:hypothetical protein